MSAIARLKSTAPLRIPRLSRFAWLMELYAENHGRLQRMFAPDSLTQGSYLSVVGEGLDVRLDIVDRHPYTIELQLAYASLKDGQTGQPDPSAHVRHYRDARQSEVTHCYVGRRWQDVLGLHPPIATVIDHRMRMNVFFGKWLEYLGEQGHSWRTLRPVEDEATTA